MLTHPSPADVAREGVYVRMELGCHDADLSFAHRVVQIAPANLALAIYFSVNSFA